MSMTLYTYFSPMDSRATAHNLHNFGDKTARSQLLV